MDLWQYNAWCEAFKDKSYQLQASQVQAAYFGAYWARESKRKKLSLKAVLKMLRGSEENPKPGPPIDVEKVQEQFRQAEELQTHGYIQCR